MLPLDTRAIQIEMTGDESGESGANHSSIPHRHVFQCVYEANAVLHLKKLIIQTVSNISLNIEL